MTRAKTILLGVLTSAGMATAAVAVEPIQQHNSNAIWFENWTGLSNAQMIVAAPNGKITTIFAENGTPVFELSGNEIPDGIYRYELSAATDEKVEIVNEIDNGRGDNQRDSVSKPFYSSGHFTVSRGVIITPEEIKEEKDG